MSADGRTTISRVAEAAGVSRATVSRVMNAREPVDPRLGERVRAAAAELGYELHPVARSLALGRTGIVALVVPDLTNPVFQGILQGLDEVAARAGHRVLVADSREDVAEEQVLATHARDRCDGIVLCAPRMDTDALRRLAPRLAPMVVVNRVVEGLGAPSVAVDHAAGIRQVVQHLVALGHRSIAYLAGPPSSASNRERLDELRVLAARHDLRLQEISCGSGSDEGYAAAPGCRDSGATAVVAYNDMVALGALHGLAELGVDVPGAMSPVGSTTSRSPGGPAPR